MADKPKAAPRKRVRKPQRDPTNALPGLLLKYRRAKGWTMRDLEARTREISEAIGAKDGGLTINLISFWERGVVRNPTLPSLDLVARALERPLDEFIEALGYRLRPSAPLYDDARRDRVGRILRIAAEDDLDRKFIARPTSPPWRRRRRRRPRGRGARRGASPDRRCG